MALQRAPTNEAPDGERTAPPKGRGVRTWLRFVVGELHKVPRMVLHTVPQMDPWMVPPMEHPMGNLTGNPMGNRMVLHMEGRMYCSAVSATASSWLTIAQRQHRYPRWSRHRR